MKYFVNALCFEIGVEHLYRSLVQEIAADTFGESKTPCENVKASKFAA